ncbi:unnamed protein product [Caenorhabditis angaria]|uniref:Uncharacterized protein n=1 Tax=Caenorhabditis angaria TaxID=860376 RepID=A0A9P1IYX1_9PELO|nr:unnamed protein product [Caenorhabditis angaria]
MIKLLIVFVIVASICGIEGRRHRHRDEKLINGGSLDLYRTAPEICKLDYETNRKLEAMYNFYKNMYYGIACDDKIPEGELIQKFLNREHLENQKAELELAFILEMCLFGSGNFAVRMDDLIDVALLTREEDLDKLPLKVQQIRRSTHPGKVEKIIELLSTDIVALRDMWMVYS